MEEIAQQFREELQEIIDRYKTRLSVPCITHVAQDVLHKTLSVKHNPELHTKEINGLKIPAELLEEPDYELKKMIQGEFIRDGEAYLAGFESRNQQLVKAKEIIKDLLQYLPKENIEGIYEATEAAEQFLRDGESKCID